MNISSLSVVPARIAEIQKPGIAYVAYIPVAWIPAIPAGMTLFRSAIISLPASLQSTN
ncbi:MAG: hypothetical protein ACXW02_08085 [Halobacteriota archaeon]